MQERQEKKHVNIEHYANNSTCIVTDGFLKLLDILSMRLSGSLYISILQRDKIDIK